MKAWKVSQSTRGRKAMLRPCAPARSYSPIRSIACAGAPTSAPSQSAASNGPSSLRAAYHPSSEP